MNKPIAIFDLDGTLYKTETVSLAAIHSAIRDVGLENKKDDEIKSLFGFTTPELCKTLFREVDEAKIHELTERVRHYERSLIREKGELYDGISKLLYELRADGWMLTICTNGSQVYVDTILDGLELKNHFEHVSLRDGAKTKSDHIRKLIKDRECPCIMIGDKTGDIDAAAANSIPSIGVLWGYGTEEEISHATFIAKNVHNIGEILSRCLIYHKIKEDLQATRDRNLTSIIVGINGVDTSGKTLFTKDLYQFLLASGFETMCVHLDDFHNEAEKRASGKDEIQAYIDNAFNLSLLEEKILKPFLTDSVLNKELLLLNLDKNVFTLKRKFQANSNTIILLEGTLLFRKPIDEYFSYRIFLDITFDEVRRRAELRDIPRFGEGIIKKYNSKYIPIQEWYLLDKKPKEKADIVIDNNNFRNPKIRKIKTGQSVLA